VRNLLKSFFSLKLFLSSKFLTHREELPGKDDVNFILPGNKAVDALPIM